jgi:hypothetical protein
MPTSGAYWAHSVAVSGDTVVAGSYSDRAVDVFIRSGATWSHQAHLVSTSPNVNGDYFGWSLAVSGHNLFVGATADESNATGLGGVQANTSMSGSGAVYHYRRTGGAWSAPTYIKASNTGSGDGFGWSIATLGDAVAIGANGEGSSASGVNGNQANNDASASGAVYVFE